MSQESKMPAPPPLTAPKRLRHLRERAGYSMDELAKAMGYAGQSSIQRYESDDSISALKHEFIERLRPHLVGRGNPVITDDEVSLLGGIRAKLAGVRLPAERAEHYRELEIADREETLRQRAFQSAVSGAAALVPLRAQIPAAGDAFNFASEPPEPIEAPPQIARVPGAFAFYALFSTMEPRFFRGEILFVHPRMPVTEGDFVLAIKTGTSNAEEAVVRQVHSLTGDHFELSQLNPKRTIKVKAKDFSLQKIVFSGKL